MWSTLPINGAGSTRLETRSRLFSISTIYIFFFSHTLCAKTLLLNKTKTIQTFPVQLGGLDKSTYNYVASR